MLILSAVVNQLCVLLVLMVDNEILNEKMRFWKLLGAFVSLHVSTRTNIVEIRLNPISKFLEFETCCIVFIRSASIYCGEYFKYLQFQSTAHDFKSIFINKEKIYKFTELFLTIKLTNNNIVIFLFLHIYQFLHLKSDI